MPNHRHRTLSTFLILALGFQSAVAVTVYYQPVQTLLAAEASQASAVAAGAKYTGIPAYNPVVLQPPAPPGPTLLPTQFTVQLTDAVPQTASKPQDGSFFGFSVEMSVVNQVSKYS